VVEESKAKCHTLSPTVGTSPSLITSSRSDIGSTKSNPTGNKNSNINLLEDANIKFITEDNEGETWSSKIIKN
jgi:hypothetical protein